MTDEGNAVGLQVAFGGFATVGGTSPDDRNLISGNNVGIFVQSDTTARIQGNTIGLDAGGTSAIPNDQGVQVAGTGTIIGGTEAERATSSRATLPGSA